MLTATRLQRVVVADDVADLRMLLRIALEGTSRFEVVAEAADGQGRPRRFGSGRLAGIGRRFAVVAEFTTPGSVVTYEVPANICSISVTKHGAAGGTGQ